MKDQYFGDVNDFRKYGLLRALVVPGALRLGVCWMLTEPDGRRDGNSLAYLDNPTKYRLSDPELFDWLKRVVQVEQERRTSRIERSDLLGSARFQSANLIDREIDRSSYFADCATRFAGCELVFFDPDNGLETRSTPRGRKNSRKYLYWDEVRRTFTGGSSVLIYQHYIRENRNVFICTHHERTAGAYKRCESVFVQHATCFVPFGVARARHRSISQTAGSDPVSVASGAGPVL